jgi:hypothetical protein
MDIDYYEFELGKLIKEMHKRREDALKRLKQIVHDSYLEEFAKVLHYSWQEGLPEAEKIAEELNFYPIDFVALALDKEEFRDLLLKENEYLMEEYG